VRLDHLLSKELSLRPSQEGRQEPGPHGLVAPGSRSLAIRSGRFSGSPSTAPRGVGNGGRERFRPHTLLSFEGASHCGPRSPHHEALPGSRTGRHVRQGGYRSRAGNLENYIASASIFRSCQVTKGTWWMPRRQKPMKDVGGCDKPRGAANQALIRGCPNGETRRGSCRVTPV
jgi:hypothetical protein